MEQTLHQHITFLEERVTSLGNQPFNPSRIEGLRADLQIAELALSHDGKALELKLAAHTAQPPLDGQNPDLGIR